MEIRLSPCPEFDFFVIDEGYSNPSVSCVCSTVFAENVFLAVSGHCSLTYVQGVF